MFRTIWNTSLWSRSSSRVSISALYSRARTCAVSDSGLMSSVCWANTRKAGPVPVAALPTEARCSPCRMATSTPFGSLRESSILATVPMLAYLPSTRGTSRTRPSPSRAAAMAAPDSSRSTGMVTTMPGSTTALLSGSSGINSVFSSGIASILLSVLVRDNLRDVRFMPKTGYAKRGPGERPDDVLDAGSHHFRRTGPIDDLELALLVVVPDQGGRLVDVDVQAMVDDPLEVVAAVALAEALPDGLRVDLQIQDRVQGPVERGQHAIQCVRLGNGPGGAVEDDALLCVGVEEPMLDEVDNQAVGHQLAAVEVGLDALAERGPRGDLGPQDVPGRDRGDAVLLGQHRRLGPLAGSGRSQQDKVQGHASMMRPGGARRLSRGSRSAPHTQSRP